MDFELTPTLARGIGMVKNDRWIREMSLAHGMIEPFEPELVRDGKISFGTSSFGYDFRLAEEIWLPAAAGDIEVIDPKAAHARSFRTLESGESASVPGHGYVMARSLEYFRMPRDVLALCTGKSTYARCGLLVNITPLEPEWEGHLTFAILNPTPSPIRIYPGEGIAQAVFIEGAPPDVSYADRKGKYQSQRGLTLPKV